MNVHGERIDVGKWMTRYEEEVKQLASVVAERLDPVFVPLVGNKHADSDAAIDEATAAWKELTKVTAEETRLKGEARKAKDPLVKNEILTDVLLLETARKTEKDRLKAVAGSMSKRRTAIKNLAAKCEGEALLNYASAAQLVAVVAGMRGCASLKKPDGKFKSFDDKALEKLNQIPVIKAIQDYRELKKLVGTYGKAWATVWVTRACKEEGWLHPGDLRLHSVFNQYMADTGRSSSDSPNGQNIPQLESYRSCFIADPLTYLRHPLDQPPGHPMQDI